MAAVWAACASYHFLIANNLNFNLSDLFSLSLSFSFSPSLLSDTLNLSKKKFWSANKFARLPTFFPFLRLLLLFGYFFACLAMLQYASIALQAHIQTTSTVLHFEREREREQWWLAGNIQMFEILCKCRHMHSFGSVNQFLNWIHRVCFGTDAQQIQCVMELRLWEICV